MSGRRVPLVLQGSDVECAAACVAMVATFFGYELSLREARDVCAIGRDGASAAAIARAARSVGLAVKAVRAGPGVVQALPLPGIAHWGNDHFVVVERVRRGRVHVVDPARGRRRLTSGQFAGEVGKVVLTMAPGPEFGRRPAPRAPFWRRYLSALTAMPGARAAVAQLLGASAVVQLLGLAVPLGAWAVIDKVVPARAGPVLPLLGAGIAVIVAAQLITGYLRGTLIVYLQGRLDTQAMISFCSHLLRLPLAYFQRRSTGDILLRVGCIGMIRELLTAQTLAAVLDVLMVVLYLGVLLAVNITVALIAAAVIAAQVALLAVSLPLARDTLAAELTTQGQAYGDIAEAVDGVATLKAAAAEHRAVSRWSELFIRWLRASLRRSHLTALVETVSGGLRTAAPLAVLWFAAAQVMHGRLSLGTAIALTWLASAIVVPLSTLAANGQRLQLVGAQLQRLADVLDSDPEIPAGPPPGGGQRPRGQISLDRVSFSYDRYSASVLREVTARIEPGTRVAIVGASGAGKTTLALLILGFYQPTGGTVRFDGTDLAAADPRLVRTRVGSVLQDAFVFSGTIADNIALHDPAITPAAIERAARLACLHDDIAGLPQGYATRIGEHGGGLSGGQRQRLAIARALAREPVVLLLDEATSHLDAATESALHANLAGLDCTQIIIAHRLSTVRDADHILVLHDGQLAEHGTHDTLLAVGGRYAALVAAQLNGHGASAGALTMAVGNSTGPAPVRQ